MSKDEIVINENGVSILGFPVGLEPTIRDFELALEGEIIRNSKTSTDKRKLRICDAKGLSWLINSGLDSVLWFTISLAHVRHRKVSDVDACSFFTDKVRTGQHTVRGPFSFETGEIVRKATIPGLEVCLVPDEKRVRAISIAFQKNEKRQ